MDQQDQGRQEMRESSPNSHQGDQQPESSSSRDLDGTWGIGSASAMDSLRRRNFNGKRQTPPSDSKPSSD